MIPTLEWTADGVRFLDQTRLPLEETYVLATTSDQVATIITTMVVRGAPAIGVAAAMGVALGIKNSSATTHSGVDQRTGEHSEDTGRYAAHRSQSVLGHRTHAPPLLRACRPTRHHHCGYSRRA